MKAAPTAASRKSHRRASVLPRKKVAPCKAASGTAELAALEREIVNVADREQQRIGKDLHDSIGQELTGIALLLKSVLARLKKEDSGARLDVEDLVGLVNQAHLTTRELARGLLPVGSEPGSLSTALQLLASNAATRLQVDVEFIDRCKGKLRLDASSATQIYRIVQEALTNAVRHGHASHVVVRLETLMGELRLTIEDNGGGFTHTSRRASQGLGVSIMQYRAHAVGAELLFESLAGGGTRVLAKCPLNAAARGVLTS